MQLKMSVTHIRVLIIAVNLALTVMLGAHAVYRLVYNREYAPEDKTLKKQLALPENDFEPPKGGRAANGGSEILRIQGVANALVPPPVVVTEAPKVDTEGGDPLPPVDPLNPVVEEGGPLEEKWEYVTAILFPDNAELNRAVLAQKSNRPRTRVTRSIPTRSTTQRTQVRSPRTPIRRTTTPARNTHVVYKFDRWVPDEKEELAVWIVDVSDREMIYEEEGTWRRYKLVRKVNDIWDRGTNEVKAVEEEETDDEKADADEEPEKKYFHLNADLPDPAEVFANRKTAPPPAATTSSTPGGSRVTNRYAATQGKAGTSTYRTAGTPITPEERRKQAIEKMRELKNLDRSKLSAEDRKGLEEAEKLMEQGVRGRRR